MDVTYLDYNASGLFPEKHFGELAQVFQKTSANPSSLHSLGRQSKHTILETTDQVLRLLNAPMASLFWTSSGSESNSWIIYSVVQTALRENRTARLLVSSLEHESTTLAALASANLNQAHVQFVKTTADGQVDLQDLETQLRTAGPWDLLSVTHASNETGVIQPIELIIKLCRETQTPMHFDCVQSFLKVPIPIAADGVQYLSFSAHKLGGLKGLGFVVVNNRKLAKLCPLIFGKQQDTLRGGTENSFAIGVLSWILKRHLQGDMVFPSTLLDLKNKFEDELKKKIPGTIIHGEKSPRLLNTTYVGFESISTESLVISLDLKKICASSGSACSAGSVDPSRTLLSMGCSPEMAKSSVRFSSGGQTRWKDYERVLEVLPSIIEKLRASSAL